MIKRIVKMTFQPDQTETFLREVFDQSKDKIRAFDGCHSMELLRDTAQPNVLFTFSVWTSEAHLNTYRASELFQQTWAKTKVLFADKPAAWSVEVVDAG
jgi:heme oxygenase (mycobilin-producing)